MVTLVIPPHWKEPVQIARRIALIVAGENAMPVVELNRSMTALQKYQLDSGNNWWLHPNKDDPTKYDLNYRYSHKWEQSVWDHIKATIELLLDR